MAGHIITRGRNKRLIIQMLATNEFTVSAIAKKFGVSQPRISQFKSMFIEEIEFAKLQLDEATQDLWIANKTNRIEALQELYDDVDKIPDRERNSKHVQQMRGIMRDVASELGELPRPVTYVDNRKVVFRMDLGDRDLDEE